MTMTLSMARRTRLPSGQHKGKSVGELARRSATRPTLAKLVRYGDEGPARLAATVVLAIGRDGPGGGGW